jgi:hypothetical protein
MKVRHDYKSEKELCDVLINHARSHGWLVFPETSEFDLLLVATNEVRAVHARPGDQIGVHAKMHPNVDVLGQALPSAHSERGPHYHAVLVPVATQEFKAIAGRCQIMVIEGGRLEHRGRRFVRDVSTSLNYMPVNKKIPYSEPLWHPDVEINTPAGVRSPKKITPWKVSAVRLCLHGLKEGYLINSDFRAAGVSMALWRQSNWVISTGQKIGKSLKYIINEAATPPHLKWPEIAAILKEDEYGGRSTDQRKRLGY